MPNAKFCCVAAFHARAARLVSRRARPPALRRPEKPGPARHWRRRRHAPHRPAAPRCSPRPAPPACRARCRRHTRPPGPPAGRAPPAPAGTAPDRACPPRRRRRRPGSRMLRPAEMRRLRPQQRALLVADHPLRQTERGHRAERRRRAGHRGQHGQVAGADLGIEGVARLFPGGAEDLREGLAQRAADPALTSSSVHSGRPCAAKAAFSPAAIGGPAIDQRVVPVPEDGAGGRSARLMRRS